MCCIKIALRRSFFEKTAQSIANGTDEGGSFVTVMRLETKLRATLTEQQRLSSSKSKNGCRNYDRHELQAVHERISIGIAADDGSLRADT